MQIEHHSHHAAVTVHEQSLSGAMKQMIADKSLRWTFLDHDNTMAMKLLEHSMSDGMVHRVKEYTRIRGLQGGDASDDACPEEPTNFHKRIFATHEEHGSEHHPASKTWLFLSTWTGDEDENEHVTVSDPHYGILKAYEYHVVRTDEHGLHTGHVSNVHLWFQLLKPSNRQEHDAVGENLERILRYALTVDEKKRLDRFMHVVFEKSLQWTSLDRHTLAPSENWVRHELSRTRKSREHMYNILYPAELKANLKYRSTKFLKTPVLWADFNLHFKAETTVRNENGYGTRQAHHVLLRHSALSWELYTIETISGRPIAASFVWAPPLTAFVADLNRTNERFVEITRGAERRKPIQVARSPQMRQHLSKIHTEIFYDCLMDDGFIWRRIFRPSVQSFVNEKLKNEARLVEQELREMELKRKARFTDFYAYLMPHPPNPLVPESVWDYDKCYHTVGHVSSTYSVDMYLLKILNFPLGECWEILVTGDCSKTPHAAPLVLHWAAWCRADPTYKLISHDYISRRLSEIERNSPRDTQRSNLGHLVAQLEELENLEDAAAEPRNQPGR